MKWREYDTRLKKLYNAIATSHCETVSSTTSQKAEDEALELMEELTEQLKK